MTLSAHVFRKGDNSVFLENNKGFYNFMLGMLVNEREQEQTILYSRIRSRQCQMQAKPEKKRLTFSQSGLSKKKGLLTEGLLRFCLTNLLIGQGRVYFQRWTSLDSQV